MKAKQLWLALDQYSNHISFESNHPRKFLLERLGYKKAEKIYQTGKDGTNYHIGYMIAGRWFNLYKMEPMRVKA